jgi:DNA-binding transcriptional ArsR family regulator
MPTPAQDGPPDHLRDHVVRDATDAEAKALASGLRLRILRLCLDEPLTNREIAQVVGKNPATVLHHVRTLVDTGYLEPLDPRRGRRGAREIPYRTTGKSWYTRTAVGSGGILEAFLSELAEVPEDRRHLARLGLRLPPAELDEFRDRLHALLTEFHDRPRDRGAPPWSVFVAVHPEVLRGDGRTAPPEQP